MMRYLLLLFLLPAVCRAAIGDVRWATVETNGWVLQVCVEGFAGGVTNGTYYNGFATNNTLTSTNALRLDVVDMGFNSSGAYQAHVDSAYGTKGLRLVTPGQLTNDVFAVGDDAVFRVALSRGIFSLTSNLTARLAAGAFAITNGGSRTNSAAATLSSQTNGSTQTYGMAKVIANHTWPGWQNSTGSTMRVRTMGFHWSAKDGQPVQCMKHIVTDASGDAVTNIATLVIDRTLPDLLPTAEYVSDFSLASFTEFDQLRIDFVAYPRIGDTNAVLDTTRNLYGRPLPASITNLCNPNATYNPFIAVVDPKDGNNTNGRATNATPQNVNSAHYFLTVGAAWNAIAGTNNLVNSRNNPGGGVVYVFTTGQVGFDWTPDTLTAGAGALAPCWALTTTYPGHTQAVITNRTGDRNVGSRVAFKNIGCTISDPMVPFNGIGGVWFDQFRFDTAGTQPILSCPFVFVTHSVVTNLAQGLRNVSANATAFALLRGNNLDGFRNGMACYTVMSNHRPTTNLSGFTITDWINTTAQPEFQIVYNNFFGGFASGIPSISFGGSYHLTNGAAIVQNVFVRTAADSQPEMSLFSSGNFTSTNVLFWHNVTLGERIADVGSNGAETTRVNRHHWSMKNNILDLSGIKKDYDTTTDANRVGNWWIMNQVNSSGNMFIECRVNSAAGGFPPEFAGLNSHHPPGTGTNIVEFAQFTSRLAYTGSGTAATGGGNYRLLSTSPGFRDMIPDWILPYDIEGTPRGRIDPPGAHAAGNVRKGGFF